MQSRLTFLLNFSQAEVKKLLDKLPASTIVMDPASIASFDDASQAVKDKEKNDAVRVESRFCVVVTGVEGGGVL